jgi:nitroreductase
LKDLFQVIEERRAVKVFNPDEKISKEELTDILELAGKAPSAWDLQHWHFYVFHDQEAKDKLFKLAYNQTQIRDAAATIAILGDKEANKNYEPVFAPLVEAGALSKEIYNALAGQIEGAYQREEYPLVAAHHNAGLAAMQLMLVAQAKGWDTCPIGGFDHEGFIKEFNVPERYVPIMIIPVGKKLKPGRPSPRLEINKLTTWI